MKKWVLRKCDAIKAAELTTKYGLDPLLAHVLAARGITDQQELKNYFSFSGELSDPFEIKDMDKAVDRIREALENCEKICIYGDYDADGVTSTVILYNYLSTLGAEVDYYIPEREGEGYGMHREALDKIKESGAELIITVDNGISAFDEVEYAKQLGIDVVITDHHRPPERIPNAVAVVNPHRKDCSSRFKDFAGVGVTFKLLCALEDGENEVIIDQFSDLVAIGTIADIVPLVDENRLIVKQGLRRIASTDNNGLYSLLEVCSLADKTITGENVAFIISPKINAAGRIGSVDEAVRMLLSEDDEEALRLANNIAALNTRRRDMEDKINADVADAIARNPKIVNQRVIFAAGEGWHMGVVGIVAARLAEQYSKPTLLMTIDDDGMAHGSARSNDGFSIVDALSACSSVLTNYGGHTKAAGFSLKAENIENFRNMLCEYARINYPEMPQYTIDIDKIVDPDELTVEKIRSLDAMEPFGEQNKRPIFAVTQAMVDEVVPLSQGKHIRLKLVKDRKIFSVLCFGITPEKSPCKRGDIVDICFNAELNEYNGNTQVSLKLKDIKHSELKQTQFFSSQQLYDRFMCDERLPQAEAEIPTRDDFAIVYRFLRANGGFSGNSVGLYLAVKDKMTYCKMMLILEILKREKLINASLHCADINIQILPIAEKVDLERSELLQQFKDLV